MKICAIADLHSNTDLVTPAADVLVVAGDLTYSGTPKEFLKVFQWLTAQPQAHKVIIAGNHDFGLQGKRNRNSIHDPLYEAQCIDILSGPGIHYLMDSSVTIDGIKFYGSPWQPWFYDWAFNLNRGTELKNVWSKIPDDTDVLVVHGPPRNYGDRTTRGERAGCDDLRNAIEQKQPKVVVYGHIHEDIGEWTLGKSKLINCSVGYRVNEHHPDGKPVIFEVNK